MCLGQDDETRDEYPQIAANASFGESSDRDDWDEGEERAPKHYKELASYVLKYVTDASRGLLDSLRGKKGAPANVNEGCQ